MSWTERPWRRTAAAIAGAALVALSLLVMARPKDFERLFLRAAGGVIEGVSDHLSVWIAGSVIAGALGWIVIGVACFCQGRGVTGGASDLSDSTSG